MRYFTVSIAYTILLVLTLVGSRHSLGEQASCMSTKYILGYFFSFGLLTITWTISFVRQLNFNKLKRHALPYAAILSVLILGNIEFLAWIFHEVRLFQLGWFISGLVGIGIGSWVFYLLFRQCY